MNAEELKDLLSKQQIKEDPTLKINEFDTHKYFKDIQGRVLMFLPSYPDEIKIFNSLQEFEKAKKIALSDQKSKHILEDYQTKLKKFDSSLIEAEKKNLSKALGLHPKEMNFSIQSLSLINEAFKRISIKKTDFLKYIYFPLFIYTGEVIRIALNGEWKLKKRDRYIEPIIKTKSRAIFYFKDLYEDVYEDYENFSIVDIVQGQLFDR